MENLMIDGFKLAIILPYYKNNFIKEALDSIQKQTNRNFNLYIGDDASPNSINEYLGELDLDFRDQILYHRFEENLGSVSLTKQWERCIALSKSETYIWLFSDDDIMPIDAVERFFSFIESGEDIDLVRFNINIINNNGQVIGTTRSHPTFETAENFIKRRLNGECISTACEYIFTRSIYESKNKFVEFPLAWCSDDATWVNFSWQKGIKTLAGKPVSWRMSGLNISSDNKTSYANKIKASIEYIKFLEKKIYLTHTQKLNYLMSQLNLLGNFKDARKEFFQQLHENKMFTNSFIKKYLFKRKINHYISRLKAKLQANF